MKIKKYTRFLKNINEQSGSDYGDDFFNDDENDENPFEESIKRKKEKSSKKDFKIGDTIICIMKEQKKLPDDAYKFLLTYNKFTVKDVNENKNIYLGFDRNGEHFMFSPNRFELYKPEPIPAPGEKKKNWWD